MLASNGVLPPLVVDRPGAKVASQVAGLCWGVVSNAACFDPAT